MTKKLYVNELNDEKTLGVATEGRFISFNLITLGRNHEESSPIFYVGRYMCFIAAQDVQKTIIKMYFLDLKKEPSLIEIAQTFGGNDMKQQIISYLEMYNMSYESNFDSVELFKDFPSFTK
jgi:hypothetical protein